MIGRRRAVLLAPFLCGLAGCTVGPKDFRALLHPAPHVRSRAVALGEGLPEPVVVPALIDRLSDPDPVVRLAAHEGLRKRTGQDFGFIPWAEPADRTRAVGRWQSWWRGRQAGLGVVQAHWDGGRRGRRNRRR